MELGTVFEFLGAVVSIFGMIWFIILPIALYYIFARLWLDNRQGKYAVSLDRVMLEIFPPREIEKSPQVMENFFYLLAGAESGPNILEEYVDGEFSPSFSLEIVSIEGTIHFYVRAQRKFREMIESGLYAQYPGIEIAEAEDYVWNVPRIVPNKEWKMWGSDFKLTKEDAYPIKTYKHFEEDITGTMIDPLHTIFEDMTSLGPGQQMWMQYIIIPSDKDWGEDVGGATIEKFLGRDESRDSILKRFWKDLIDVIGAVFTGWFSAVEFNTAEESKSEEQPIEFRLTPGQKKTLTALEENAAKPFFAVKMRAIVIGKTEGFSKVHANAITGTIMKGFSDGLHNSLRTDKATKTSADYVFKPQIVAKRSRQILERYRHRDPSGVMFHFSTEELATVFHMPDMSVIVPGVQYIDSKRGSAPSNLPFS